MKEIKKLKKAKIKKGDTVIVITGDDKGKQGKVLNVDYKTARVTVEGVNIVKKTLRRTQSNPQGGIIEIEAPIHISNVMIVCPNCNKQTRVKYKILENGKKVRVCKKCNNYIDKV